MENKTLSIESQVHDRVMGEIRMYLDSFQMQEIDEYCNLWQNTLAIGWQKGKTFIKVYFNNGKSLVYDRNY